MADKIIAVDPGGNGGADPPPKKKKKKEWGHYNVDVTLHYIT